MQDPAGEVEAQAFAQILRQELERRLALHAEYTDQTFGSISLFEASLTALIFGGIPLMLLWLYA